MVPLVVRPELPPVVHRGAGRTAVHSGTHGAGGPRDPRLKVVMRPIAPPPGNGAPSRNEVSMPTIRPQIIVRPRRTTRPVAGGRRRPRLLADAGMATAEYAVVTVAACGFAGLLVALLRSDQVRGLLLGIIRRALAG